MNKLTLKPIIKLSELSNPSRNGKLVDVNLAQSFIDYYNKIKEGSCSVEQAAKCAEVLIGSYPYHRAPDPKIYARAITSVLAGYHLDVSKKAVDYVTRSCKFIPTRADVESACLKVLNEAGLSALIAKRHLREAERRKNEKARDAAISSSENNEEREKRISTLIDSLMK